MSRRSRRGLNALEFALVAPLLFLSMFSVFECGWIFCHQVVLDELVSDASRSLSTAEPENINSIYSEEVIIATERWKQSGLSGMPIIAYNTSGTTISVQGIVAYDRIGPYNVLSLDEITSEITTVWPGGAP